MHLFVRLDDFKGELQGGREERGAPKNTALCLTGLSDRLVTKQPSSALKTFLVRFLEKSLYVQIPGSTVFVQGLPLVKRKIIILPKHYYKVVIN